MRKGDTFEYFNRMLCSTLRHIIALLAITTVPILLLINSEECKLIEGLMQIVGRRGDTADGTSFYNDIAPQLYNRLLQVHKLLLNYLA